MRVLRRFGIGMVVLAGLATSCSSQEFPPRDTSSDLLRFSRVDRATSLATGVGATVAVVDWQFDPNAQAASRFVNAASMVPGERMGDLKPWHGAWMVETVHRIAPDAKIIPIIGRSLKVTSYQDALLRGIRFAADHGAVAVSSSMGPVRLTPELTAAIDYAEARGTLFVNVHPESVPSGPDKFTPCAPEQCDPRIVRAGVVSVPAHPVKPHPSRDVCTWPYDLDARYQDGWGFSNAPPTVTGVIALMKGVNPALTPARIRTLLRETAYERDGFRVLDAEAAVKAAKLMTVQ